MVRSSKGLLFLEVVGTAQILLPTSKVPSQVPTAMAEREWYYLPFSELKTCWTALFIHTGTGLGFVLGFINFYCL